MSLKDDPKKVLPPLKKDIEYMEWRKKQPPPTYEQMKEQLRTCKEHRTSKEYQDEERRRKANWPKFVEDWHKKYGT